MKTATRPLASLTAGIVGLVASTHLGCSSDPRTKEPATGRTSQATTCGQCGTDADCGTNDYSNQGCETYVCIEGFCETVLSGGGAPCTGGICDGFGNCGTSYQGNAYAGDDPFFTKWIPSVCNETPSYVGSPCLSDSDCCGAFGQALACDVSDGPPPWTCEVPPQAGRTFTCPVTGGSDMFSCNRYFLSEKGASVLVQFSCDPNGPPEAVGPWCLYDCLAIVPAEPLL
jgi:hypothetical protein